MNHVTRAFEWIETRLDAGAWVRRGIAVFTLFETYWLTKWGASYASLALSEKADLMGIAATIGAVAGIPLALLTLLFKSYVESRKEGPANAS